MRRTCSRTHQLLNIYKDLEKAMPKDLTGGQDVFIVEGLSNQCYRFLSKADSCCVLLAAAMEKEWQWRS